MCIIYNMPSIKLIILGKKFFNNIIKNVDIFFSLLNINLIMLGKNIAWYHKTKENITKNKEQNSITIIKKTITRNNNKLMIKITFQLQWDRNCIVEIYICTWAALLILIYTKEGYFLKEMQCTLLQRGHFSQLDCFIYIL